VSEQEAESTELEDAIAAEMGDDPADGEPEQESDETATVPPDDAPALAEDSAARIEEVGKKLDLLGKHVAKRMSEILGEDAQLFEQCEGCYYWNVPGWRMKGPAPQEVADHLRVWLGDHAEADYLKDNYSRVCDACNGLGLTLTGSKVPGQDKLICIPCNGNGWIAVGDERNPYALRATNGATFDTPQHGALSPVAPLPGEPEPPEVAALKARGYMVIAPIETPA